MKIMTISKSDLDWLRETFEDLSFAVQSEFNWSREMDEASEQERKRGLSIIDKLKEGNFD